jgi:hypothetical protein
MNKERRNRIENIINGIDYKIDKDRAKEIKNEIRDIQLDEQIAFDNMPEGLQSSERGETSEESIDLMDTAIDMIDEFLSDKMERPYEEFIDYLSETLEDILYL